MSLSPSFTSEGVYVGAAEYGIYAAIARMVLIAAVSDIVIRVFFAQRAGLYLVADISVNAGARSLLASLRLAPSWTRRLKAMALFSLAFFVTRGLDLLASAYSSTVQSGRMQRLAFVRTVDVAPGARALIFSPATERLSNRTDVYHALRDIMTAANLTTSNSIPAASRWPEVMGLLTEAEVAALVVDPNGMCISTGAAAGAVSPSLTSPPKAPFHTIARARNISFDIDDFWHNNAPPLSLFGEHTETFNLVLESTPGSPIVNGQRSFQFTLPISTQFLGTNQHQSSTSPASSEAVSDLTSRTRQHFGVIANSRSDLIAYNMTCGLSPLAVEAWLKQRQPAPGANSPNPINPRNSSLLWYADHARFVMNDHGQGTGLAVSAFLYLPLDPLLQRGEVELLTFGTVLYGGSSMHDSVAEGANFALPTFKVIPQISKLEGFGSLTSRLNTRKTHQSVLPLGPFPNRPLVTQSSCEQEQSSAGSTEDRDEAKLSSAKRSMVQRCQIDLGRHAGPRIGNRTVPAPTPRSMVYLHGPADRGAQICTVKARGMVSVKEEFVSVLSEVFSDLMVATRFPSPPAAAANATLDRSNSTALGQRSTVSSATARLTTSCLPASGEPPYFPFAARSNGRWGTISDPSVEAFGKTTADDPQGAQVWCMDVALLPWWELAVIASVALLLSILGHWGDLAESLLVPMYAYAFRPIPPALRARDSTVFRGGQGGADQDLGEHTPALTRTIWAIDLVEPVQYVAIEYAGATGSHVSSLPIATLGHAAAVGAADSATDLHHPVERHARVTIDARLVPATWNVTPGADLSPFPFGSCASKEQVVAAGGLLKDVVENVHQKYSMQQQGDKSPV